MQKLDADLLAEHAGDMFLVHHPHVQQHTPQSLSGRPVDLQGAVQLVGGDEMFVKKQFTQLPPSAGGRSFNHRIPQSESSLCYSTKTTRSSSSMVVTPSSTLRIPSSASVFIPSTIA